MSNQTPSEKFDSITEPQEWIDGLIDEYSPIAKDIDVALQNMGLRIKALQAELARVREALKPPPCKHKTSRGWGRFGPNGSSDGEMWCDKCGKQLVFRKTAALAQAEEKP